VCVRAAWREEVTTDGRSFKCTKCGKTSPKFTNLLGVPMKKS